MGPVHRSNCQLRHIGDESKWRTNRSSRTTIRWLSISVTFSCLHFRATQAGRSRTSSRQRSILEVDGGIGAS